VLGEGDLGQLLMGDEAAIADRVTERVVDGVDERLVAVRSVERQLDLEVLFVDRLDSRSVYLTGFDACMDLLGMQKECSGSLKRVRTHCIQCDTVSRIETREALGREEPGAR
jgi:hypothetical protein